MGIQGLLPALDSIKKKRHVKDYNGLKVAVDSYCWLHKAVYSCAFDVAHGKSYDRLV